MEPLEAKDRTIIQLKGAEMKAMNRYILISLLAAGTFISTAMAAVVSTDVAVTAKVVGACKITTVGTPTVDFGNLDPSNAVDVNNVAANPQPSFWCTNGTNYTITDDLGTHENGSTPQLSNGTENIPYSFTYAATGVGAGPGTSLNMNFKANLAGTAYQGVSPGTYSDTVHLTITFTP